MLKEPINKHNQKTCSKCKEVKYKSDFNKNKATNDGLQYECEVCQKEYRNRNKSDMAEYQKHWYQQNKFRISDEYHAKKM